MTEPTDVPTSVSADAEATEPLNEVQKARAERAKRLAQALRDNLRRRKAAQPRREKPGN